MAILWHQATATVAWYCGLCWGRVSCVPLTCILHAGHCAAVQLPGRAGCRKGVCGCAEV